MDEHGGVRQFLTKLAFEAFDQLMSARYRPRAGDEDVQRDEAARPRFPAAQGVVVDSLATIAFKDAENLRLLFAWQTAIHQSVGRAAQQLPGGPHDVAGDEQGENRVQP